MNLRGSGTSMAMTFCGVAMLCAAGGCVTREKDGATPRPATRLEIDGDRLSYLPTVDSAAFRALFSRAKEDAGDAAADRLTKRFPDAALDAMLRPPDDELRVEIEKAYDRACADGRGETEDIIARLREDDREPGETATMIERATAVSARHLSAGLRLRAVAEHRIAGRIEDAGAFWTAAVDDAAAANDPEMVRRLIDERPPGTAWPTAGPIKDEWTALEAVTRMELDRGERSRAVVDLLKLESGAPDETARDRARLERARVLFALGRTGESMALLRGIVQSRSPEIARSGFALGGVIAASLDDLDRSIELFERSLDGDDHWSGAPRAVADLALSYLRAGRTADGLSALERAQTALERIGDFDGLARALKNEIVVRRNLGQTELADAAAGRLANVEREHGVSLIDP